MTVEYNQALKAYKIFGTLVAAQELTPTHAAPTTLHSSNPDQRWLTIKEVVEGIAQQRLPDIKMSDAIALAKITPFSTEEWLTGCSSNPRII
jgi:hypothetical protein